jgi:hypothetical protein
MFISPLKTDSWFVKYINITTNEQAGPHPLGVKVVDKDGKAVKRDRREKQADILKEKQGAADKADGPGDERERDGGPADREREGQAGAQGLEDGGGPEVRGKDGPASGAARGQRGPG